MNNQEKNMLLRQLPKMDEILPKLSKINIRYDILKKIVKSQMEKLREEIVASPEEHKDLNLLEHILCKCHKAASRFTNVSLVRVINGTGVLLHTNLGRSVQETYGLSEVLNCYSNLEFDLSTGQRGDRSLHFEEPLKLITGCESAIAVNNNAAAVMLVLSALAADKEVIVSRGEQVEIGGSFRIPEVAKLSRATIKEVGTTNVTRISDYAEAVSDNTFLIMRVEPSNFSLIGQSRRPDNVLIYNLCAELGIPYYLDLGSGTLEPSALKGFVRSDEIHSKDIKSMVNRADIVSFSGDKLLGSSQAGVIVGKKKYIDKLRKHPLYRAMRMDKGSVYLLASSLSAYIRGDENKLDKMLSETVGSIRERVDRFINKSSGLKDYNIKAIKLSSSVGGGTFASSHIDSYGVEINHRELNSEQLFKKLRSFSTPIIAMNSDNVISLDFRTISDSDGNLIIKLLSD